MYCIYIYFILFYIMYNIHIVKRFRAHCGLYAIENKLLFNYYYYNADRFNATVFMSMLSGGLAGVSARQPLTRHC